MITRFGCLALVILAQQTPGIPPPSTAARPTGLIVGQVVDAASGRPVPNVVVTLTGLPPVRVVMEAGRIGMAAGLGPPRILTGSDGRFLFRDLPRGSFGISVMKPGYTPSAYGMRRPGGSSQQIALNDAERLGDVVIRIWKQASISGRVLDEAGEAVIGTRVRAFKRGGLPDPQRLTTAATAMTDDRGIYRFGLLDPGEYFVGVVSRTVVVPLAAVRPGPGVMADLGVAVPSPGTTNGIQVGNNAVGLGSGAPIPPAPVGEKMMTYQPAFYPSVNDPREAVPIVLAAGEERDGVDLQTRPAPTVRVSGTLGGAQETAMLPVRLVPASTADLLIDGDAPGAVTIANRGGAFTFESVPSGEYLLRVSTRLRFVQSAPEDMLYAELPVTVAQSDIDGLTVVLRPGLRIAGSFQFEGTTPRPANLSNVALSLEPAGGSLVAPMPTSAPRPTESGEFEAAGLAPGRYYVRVAGSPRGWMFKSATLNGRDVADTAIDLRNGDAFGVVITFSDRWSGLGGVVTTSSGAPDPDALVIAFPTDPQTWSSTGFNPRRIKSVRPSKSGQYTFATLPPGQYYVTAVPDRQAADWRDPRFLEAASRGARQVAIGDGERKTQDVRTREVR